MAKKVLVKTGYKENKEISVFFVKDKTIKKLNKTYRDKNIPTDVLSFLPGFVNTNILGDIVISTETAKKNAKINNHTYTKEILILFIHGLLHLLGYEHENVSLVKKNKMFKLQDDIIRGI